MGLYIVRVVGNDLSWERERERERFIYGTVFVKCAIFISILDSMLNIEAHLLYTILQLFIIQYSTLDFRRK